MYSHLFVSGYKPALTSVNFFNINYSPSQVKIQLSFISYAREKKIEFQPQNVCIQVKHTISKAEL